MKVEFRKEDEGGGVEVDVTENFAFSCKLGIEWVSIFNTLKQKVQKLFGITPKPPFWAWINLHVIELYFERNYIVPWYGLEINICLLGFCLYFQTWSPKMAEEHHSAMMDRFNNQDSEQNQHKP